jgi:pimeloyl-ACP methyl ester carboxylesterase
MQAMTKQIYQTFLRSLLLFSLLAGVLPSAAQRPGARTTPQPAKQSNAPSSSSCTGGWSGIVRYRRVFEDSFNQTATQKSYSGAYTKIDRTQSKQVSGKIVLDGKIPAGMPNGFAMNVGGVTMGATAQTGRTNVTFTETLNEATQTAYQDSCGWETREKKCQGSTTQQGVTMAERDEQFMLDFQGDRYGFSFRLPEASGTLEKTVKQTCTGYCNGGKDVNENYIDAVRYDRESVSVKNQKLDPKNPDRLQGIDSQPSRDGKTSITVWWNLRRCAPPLQLIDLYFQEHRFPNHEEWVGMSARGGTIDGNRVRIVARVLNTSMTAQTATLNFSEAAEALPQPNVTATVPGGEIKDVEYIWDTRGFAWEAGGAPHSDRKITVKMNSETISEDVSVKPKPVVLIGGYFTKPEDFRLYEDYLKRTHIDWTATPVGSFSGVGKAIDPMISIGENARELETHIRYLRQRFNAWHVDAVAHSTGGLIARYYVHQFMKDVYTNRAEIAHLVMLGTPNNGSPCAHIFRKNNLIMGRPTLPMSQLLPGPMQIFNRDIYKRNRTRFSALAGTVSPITCVSFQEGDGFTPAVSAAYNIDDSMYIRLPHQSLTSEHVFKNFVKQRLALDPATARAEEASFNGQNFPARENPAVINSAATNAFPNIPATWQASAGRAMFSDPLANADDDTPAPGVTLDTVVKVPAGKSTEIDVPVLTGARAAIVLAADANVTATLTDARGKIIGISAGAEAGQIFRSIAVEKPSAGNLKLRLENAGAEESTALVAAWTDTDPLQFTLTAAPNAAGQIALQAKLTLSESPVTGAVIRGSVSRQKTEIVFYDDGKHGDGAAGDGIYGAILPKPPKGDYAVTATAETNGQTRAASAFFSADNAAK